MIHGLLHGRLLGGAPGGGVIASPAYQAQLAFATGTSSSSATASFTIHPNGTWTSGGTGYGDKSGTWFSPVTAGAGDAYEVRITPTLASGVTGVLVNEATDWVPLSSAREFADTVQRFTTGITTSGYSVQVEIRLTGGAVVSTGSFTLTASAEVKTAGGGGTGCPALDMWLSAGLVARDVRVGQVIDGVATDDDDRSRLPVLAGEVSVQACYRIVTTNGAACVLSDSTPFTLRDGTTRLVGEMLGQDVLRDDGAGGLAWDTVAECYPVGDLPVIRISVGGHSLLAGENPLMRIVSHNQSKQ